MDSDLPPAVRDALASHADSFAVIDELHDVPPHRVYEVRADGRRAVLKIDDHPRGHAAAEGRVQEYVAERTSIPAPEVVAVGDDYFLAEWDDDLSREPEPIDERWAHAAGALLGRLHAETEGDFDAFGRPRAGDDGLALDGRDDWTAAVIDRLRYHRSYLDGVGHADVADALEEVLVEFPGVLDGAGDPVLCHGNAHPEHVATADGEAVSVVDFEHALVAPGEYDYWRAAIPLFERRPDVRTDASRSFRDGYESASSLAPGFERRREVYLLANTVSYLESLYLQENVDGPQREARAEQMRERVFDGVARLRAERR